MQGIPENESGSICRSARKKNKADVQASLFVAINLFFFLNTRRTQLYSRRNSGAVGYRCEGVGVVRSNNYNKRRLGFETNKKNLASKITSQ